MRGLAAAVMLSSLVTDVASAQTVFFLNKDGGTYSPGIEDSRTNQSSLLDSTRAIPAFDCGTAEWETVLTCVREQFARYDVTVTDVDPGNVPHYEGVIGGTASDAGQGNGTGGMAPKTCEGTPNAITFTFSETLGCGSLRLICETAAQELAHAFSLDHVFYCQDTMTYLTGCGDKSFQDHDAACGEFMARECQCGGLTQNSHQLLLAALGPAPAPTPSPSPSPSATVTPTPTPANPADGDATGCSCRTTGGSPSVAVALVAVVALLVRRRPKI